MCQAVSVRQTLVITVSSSKTTKSAQQMLYFCFFTSKTGLMNLYGLSSFSPKEYSRFTRSRTHVAAVCSYA